ncbi:MAG TPA: hypothetical protein VFV62_01315 [Gaiellaceae bacterium]|nr:hypothetical protein [Gaiellaceae bacterium]
MSVAEPKRAAVTTQRVCQCKEPLIQTRVGGKWHSDRYCERCGLLAPIVFRR